MTRLDLSRWTMGGAYGGRRYNWPQCRFCGVAGRDHAPADCPLCGTRQCNSRPECRMCLYGWLPGWSRGLAVERQCGYKGCGNDAIATAPRVKRVCAEHVTRIKVNGKSLGEHVITETEARDAGKGWQRWRWVETP